MEIYRNKKGQFKKGKPSFNKGIKLPKKWVDNLSKGHKGIPSTVKGKHWKLSKQSRINIGNGQRKWKIGVSINLQKQELKAGRKKPKNCELCGRVGKIVFDHCHKTGKFRGWICYKCNTSLGLAGDDLQTLLLMVEYIKKSL